VEESKLSSYTLWFSLWDWDRFGKNEFLGEVKLPLTEAKLDGQSQLYGLTDNSDIVSSVPLQCTDSVGLHGTTVTYNPSNTSYSYDQ